MCWPQVVEDRKGFFDRFKLRINIFMLWWCFYIFLLQQTQITQNSASSLIQLFHLTVYFLQLIHKSPGLLSLFWVVWIKNIICFFFCCNYKRRKGPKCRNTREADRIQDLRACFIKQKLNDTKKWNMKWGQKDKVATNQWKHKEQQPETHPRETLVDLGTGSGNNTGE